MAKPTKSKSDKPEPEAETEAEAGASAPAPPPRQRTQPIVGSQAQPARPPVVRATPDQPAGPPVPRPVYAQHPQTTGPMRLRAGDQVVSGAARDQINAQDRVIRSQAALIRNYQELLRLVGEPKDDAPEAEEPEAA